MALWVGMDSAKLPCSVLYLGMNPFPLLFSKCLQKSLLHYRLCTSSNSQAVGLMLKPSCIENLLEYRCEETMRPRGNTIQIIFAMSSEFVLPHANFCASQISYEALVKAKLRIKRESQCYN